MHHSDFGADYMTVVAIIEDGGSTGVTSSTFKKKRTDPGSARLLAKCFGNGLRVRTNERGDFLTTTIPQPMSPSVRPRRHSFRTSPTGADGALNSSYSAVRRGNPRRDNCVSLRSRGAVF